MTFLAKAHTLCNRCPRTRRWWPARRSSWCQSRPAESGSRSGRWRVLGFCRMPTWWPIGPAPGWPGWWQRTWRWGAWQNILEKQLFYSMSYFSKNWAFFTSSALPARPPQFQCHDRVEADGRVVEIPVVVERLLVGTVQLVAGAISLSEIKNDLIWHFYF